jgi:hypothetical protein
MTRWLTKIQIKHLFTEDEDYDSVQKSMKAVAQVLKEARFPKRLIDECLTIPEEYSLVVANSIMSRVYDYADMERIWVD